MNVLILTKCILAEEEFTRRLYMLGYEVFCSFDLLSRLKNKMSSDTITKYFQIIIISETVPDNEVEYLLENREFQSSTLYRKSSTMIEVSKNEESPIQAILATNESLESLREKLSQNNKKNTSDKFANISPLAKENIKSFFPFSKQEKIVFELLREADGEIVSREEICEKIWSKVTQSNLARTSSIVKRIKIKLEGLGIDDSSLQTLWGKGYRLIKG
nr:helix-turn-helix domain-containing protein [Enterococcus sp. 665A]